MKRGVKTDEFFIYDQWIRINNYAHFKKNYITEISCFEDEQNGKICYKIKIVTDFCVYTLRFGYDNIHKVEREMKKIMGIDI